MKPTRGVVDMRGAMPLSHSNDHIGLLARNFLGVPALSLPCGFTAGTKGRRLPVGFQLIGGPYADANLLAIGVAWQAHTDSHRQSPGGN